MSPALDSLLLPLMSPPASNFDESAVEEPYPEAKADVPDTDMTRVQETVTSDPDLHSASKRRPATPFDFSEFSPPASEDLDFPPIDSQDTDADPEHEPTFTSDSSTPPSAASAELTISKIDSATISKIRELLFGATANDERIYTLTSSPSSLHVKATASENDSHRSTTTASISTGGNSQMVDGRADDAGLGEDLGASDDERGYLDMADMPPHPIQESSGAFRDVTQPATRSSTKTGKTTRQQAEMTDVAAMLKSLKYQPHACPPVKSNKRSSHSQKAKAEEIGSVLNDALVWKALKQVGVPTAYLPPYPAPDMDALHKIQLESGELLKERLSEIITNHESCLVDASAEVGFTHRALGHEHLKRIPTVSRYNNRRQEQKRMIVVPAGQIQTFGEGKHVLDENGREIVTRDDIRKYALLLGAMKPDTTAAAAAAVNRKVSDLAAPPFTDPVLAVIDVVSCLLDLR